MHAYIFIYVADYRRAVKDTKKREREKDTDSQLFFALENKNYASIFSLSLSPILRSSSLNLLAFNTLVWNYIFAKFNVNVQPIKDCVYFVEYMLYSSQFSSDFLLSQMVI